MTKAALLQGKIWVIDDDQSIRWVLRKALEAAAFDVTAFDNGASALDALQRRLPDVIFADIRMPGINGLELLMRIREYAPQLPVIIMTAHSDLDSAVSAYQGGAFEYLPKPFDLDEAVAMRTVTLSEDEITEMMESGDEEAVR